MSTEPLIIVPEREYGPAPWHAWLGELTPERIDLHLQRFLDMEIYEIIPILLYGLKPEYLGREYMDLYQHLCKRCQEWGMKVWIYDEFNWPSGTCAGRVLRDFPEARQKIIKFTWPEKDLQGTPTWEIVEFDGFNLAAYGAEWALNSNGYLDTLSEEAVSRFIELTHEAYKRELGDYFGDVIKGFFTDEPVTIKADAKCLPYTPGLFEQFKDRFGYDLPERMLALVTDTPDAFRVRQDYWALVIELFRVNCFHQIAQWCGKHDLKLTGHMLFEEVLSGNLHKNGDMFEMLSEFQVPGIDLLDSRTSFDRGPRVHQWGSACWDITGKLIESITFFCERERNLCEAFGCTPNSDTAQTYKRAADFLLHHGLSIINDNLFAESASSYRKFCGCHTFWTPWVRHYDRLSRHMTTLCYLNSGSRLETQVAVYYPGLDVRVRYGTPGTMFGVEYTGCPRDPAWETTQQTIYQVSHGLLQHQWDYYYLFDQVLGEAEVKDGALSISGFDCRAIVFPEIHYVSPEVADVLDRFLEAGGRIIGVGRVPKVVGADGRVTERGWENHPGVTIVHGALDEIAGQVADALASFVERKVEIRGSNLEEVMVTHRVSHGKEHVFITNFGEKPVEFDSNLDESWCELDTLSRTAAARSGSAVTLAPNESVLFMRTDSQGDTRSEAAPAGQQVIELAPEWRLRLPQGNILSLPVQIYKGDAGDAPPTNAGKDSWHEPCTEIPPVELEPEKPYWLRSRVVLEYQPEKLELVVDGCDSSEVLVNGTPVSKITGRVLWDDENISYDLRELMRPGENEFMIKHTPARVRRYVSRMLRAPDLSLFVLVGDFSVRRNRNAMALAPLPDTVTAGSLYEQGFPNLVGIVEYEQEVTVTEADDAAILDLGRQRDAFEVLANGREAGVLLWPPYRLRVGHLLRPGKNSIVLRLLTPMGGILRRHLSSIEEDRPPIGLVDNPRLLLGAI